ncbi:hypothetical protein [Candidatus Ichthyocystis hellenicum]|uniref:hypothetical protein n=1 Tax=Candidatus Ichthyocystis hellenicum TaxID=1561003 RepID=UPI000B8095CA|nr:hypothetical protein [Candidatus Ichthyocystis hellenicum]
MVSRNGCVVSSPDVVGEEDETVEGEEIPLATITRNPDHQQGETSADVHCEGLADYIQEGEEATAEVLLPSSSPQGQILNRVNRINENHAEAERAYGLQTAAARRAPVNSSARYHQMCRTFISLLSVVSVFVMVIFVYPLCYRNGGNSTSSTGNSTSSATEKCGNALFGLAFSMLFLLFLVQVGLCASERNERRRFDGNN